MVLTMGMLWRGLRLASLARAYNIAIIGFPKSGKTCLVTAMFGELFANRIAGVSTVPRGKETIEKVNADLEKLDIGRVLGPTTDQDLFAYRADISFEGFPFRRRYKVEIGDFPGDDSEKFADEFGDWFHETDYFKWAMEADAFIFVVDLAFVLSPVDREKYIARMRKAIRAAWHHVLEYHLAGQKKIKRKRVAFVFTKADLLVSCEQEISPESSACNEEITEHIMQLGFGDTLPKPFHVDQLDPSLIVPVEHAFTNLTKYLRSQSGPFETIFVSVVACDKHGRLGIRKLLDTVLPR